MVETFTVKWIQPEEKIIWRINEKCLLLITKIIKVMSFNFNHSQFNSIVIFLTTVVQSIWSKLHWFIDSVADETETWDNSLIIFKPQSITCPCSSQIWLGLFLVCFPVLLFYNFIGPGPSTYHHQGITMSVISSDNSSINIVNIK